MATGTVGNTPATIVREGETHSGKAPMFLDLDDPKVQAKIANAIKSLRCVSGSLTDHAKAQAATDWLESLRTKP